MSLPLFHVDPDLLAGVAEGDDLALTGSEGHHAATVRRLGAGDRLVVADGLGGSAVAVVTDVAPGGLRLRVERRDTEPDPDPRFVLVQALAKGGRDEDAVEAATELGVDEVLPWQAARSIVQWRGPKAEKGRAKWLHTVEAAAKQSRRTRTPSVSSVVTTRELAERVRSAGAAYVLHEEATTSLAGLGDHLEGEVLLLVGPEGGIGAEELAVLTGAGATPVRLGPFVLRSSTAGPAALAVLSARERWR